MKFRNCKGSIWVWAFLFILAAGSASARDTGSLSKLPEHEIEKLLTDAKLYRALKTSKAIIDSDQRCGIEIRKAYQTDRQLKQLNQTYFNRQPRGYQEEARRLKNANTRAIRDYRTCFSEALQSFPDLTADGIYSFDSHKAKFSDLHRQVGNVGNLDEYISELERLLEEGISNQVAYIDSVGGGSAQIKRGARQSWMPLVRGMEVKEGDTIRIGPGSRARLKFTPRDPSDSSGPTVINLGGNTELILEKSLFEPTTRRSTGFLSLIRGTIRAVSANWGSGSSFGIRTGTSICGIRGTEVAVAYDPRTGVAEATLDHGDAFVEAGGRRVTLQPRTSVRVRANSIGRPRAISQSRWDQLVAVTESIGQATPPGAVQSIGGARQTMPGESQPREHAAVPERTPGPSQPLSETEREKINRAFGAFPALLSRTVAESYFDSLTESDVSGVLRTSTGSLRAFHRANMFRAPLPELAGNSFIDVKSRCSVCDQPDQTCEVLVELGELVDRSVMTRSVMATVVKDDRRKSKVSALEMATPASLSAFHARQPYCE